MATKSLSPAALQILEEIGIANLPEEWSIVRIEDLLCDDRGIAVGVMYPGEHDPFGIPLIRAGDLAGSRINPRPDFRITADKHHEYRRTELSGRELLVSLVGEVGRCALVPLEMAGWNAARAVAVLRFIDPSDGAFVRLCLMSPQFQHLMQAWSTTTVQATLNLKEIRQIPIPWPPREQRSAIAAVIGALDDKIELNCRMNEALEATARLFFKDWFVDFGPTRAKAEGHPPYLAPELWTLFPDALDDDDKPIGWEVSTIGQEVRVVGGSTPSTQEPAYWDGELCWATPKDLSSLKAPVLLNTERRITQAGISQISSGLLPIGSVLLSSRAPIGYLVISQVETAVNQGFIAMICEERLSNVFTWLWTQANMEAIHQKANGSTFQEISKANFRPIPVTVAHQPVLRAFDEIAQPLYKQIVANEQENHGITQTRDLLLPKLMSGEIRLCEAEKLVEQVA